MFSFYYIFFLPRSLYLFFSHKIVDAHFICEMNNNEKKSNNPLDNLISVYFSIYSFEFKQNETKKTAL